MFRLANGLEMEGHIASIRSRPAKLTGRSFRWVVTVGLLVLVASVVDLSEVAHLIEQSGVSFFAIALFLLLVQAMFGGVRSWVLLAGQGRHLRIRKAIRIFLLGSLANAAFISLISGALTRIFLLRSYGVSFSSGILSIVVEKYVVVATLAVAALGGFLVVGDAANAPLSVVLVAFPISLISALILIFAIVRNPVSEWLPPFVRDSLKQLAADIRKLLTAPTLLGWAFVLSFAGLTCLLAAYCVVAYALHVDVPWTVLIAVLPIVIFFAGLPISIGGWGIREGSLVLMLAPFNVPLEHAVILSVTIGVLSFLANVLLVVATVLPQRFAALGGEGAKARS